MSSSEGVQNLAAHCVGVAHCHLIAVWFYFQKKFLLRCQEIIFRVREPPAAKAPLGVLRAKPRLDGHTCHLRVPRLG